MPQWCDVTHYLPFLKEAETINPNGFHGWGLKNSLKIGWKSLAYLCLTGVVLENSLEQGEETAGLQLGILSLPHGEGSFSLNI